MFSHVCVILFTGGSASVHAGRPPWEGDTPWKETSQKEAPPEGGTPWKETSPKETPLEGGPPGKETPPGRRPPKEAPKKEAPPGRRHTQEGDPPGRRHPQKEAPPRRRPPEGGTPQHTVNERPVRILQECILVNFNIQSYLLYLHIILVEIKIKICKIYTEFHIYFINVHCCTAEFLV